MIRITLVAAGSYDQYITWCFDNGIDPKNHRVKCVRKREDLRGYDPSGADLVKKGTWYMRPGLDDAIREFEARAPIPEYALVKRTF